MRDDIKCANSKTFWFSTKKIKSLIHRFDKQVLFGARKSCSTFTRNVNIKTWLIKNLGDVAIV